MDKDIKYSEPFISIIVPVYNSEDYLQRCVDSIINQTYTNWECILVDDGSNDKSGTICDRFALQDERISVIHKDNNGVSSARNIGIASACGKWIYFIDSDDYVDEDALQSLIIKLNVNIDLLIHGFTDDYDEGKVVIKHNYNANDHNTIPQIIEYADRMGLLRGPVCKLFKAQIIQKYNILFDTTMSYGEDTKFSFEYLGYCNAIGLVPLPLYYYCHRRGNSLTARNYNYCFWISIAQLLRDIRLPIMDQFNMQGTYLQYIRKVYFEHLIRGVFSLYIKETKIANRSVRLSLLNDIKNDSFLCGYQPVSMGHRLMRFLLRIPYVADFVNPCVLSFIEISNKLKYNIVNIK